MVTVFTRDVRVLRDQRPSQADPLVQPLAELTHGTHFDAYRGIIPQSTL